MALETSRLSIVALCGSLSENSATRRALEIALEGARESGAQTQLLDLREFSLPFCGQSTDEFPDVARLSTLLRGASGMIWGTPEYHGSYSGVLKNALDLMGFEEFEGKMIGLVGTAGGGVGAIHALGHLRDVGRQLHAWVLPQQVSIAASHRAFAENGRPRHTDEEKRLLELGRQLARFSRLHAMADDAFVKMWESSAQSAGEE